MNDKDTHQQIQELRREVDRLRGIIETGRYPSRQVILDRVEYRGEVTMSRPFIKAVDDISLTAIGDTSATNQSTNITANFNKIINALTNQ
jgi:hypothetical protein